MKRCANISIRRVGDTHQSSLRRCYRIWTVLCPHACQSEEHKLPSHQKVIIPALRYLESQCAGDYHVKTSQMSQRGSATMDQVRSDNMWVFCDA